MASSTIVESLQISAFENLFVAFWVDSIRFTIGVEKNGSVVKISQLITGTLLISSEYSIYVMLG